MAEEAAEAEACMSKGLIHESAHNATVEWYTPPWLFEALGRAYDLDPCHPEGDRLPWVPAAHVYTKADDGLSKPWFGRVWLNPPYGKEAEAWLAIMHEHRHGHALVFSRTDNAWFHEYGAQADAVFFFRKRIKFVDRTGELPRKEDGTKADAPGAGSMLIAWGPDCVADLYRLERAGLGYVFGRHRSRWEASVIPPSRLGALHWVPFLPELDLEHLLDILYQWRHYFGLGPSADTETQLWATEFHRRLGGEKNARRGKKRA